jgi:preprotein translocase subunit SecG
VTILTKATWWCGGIFLALSLVLSFVPRSGGASALQEKLRSATPGTLPTFPGTKPAPSAPAGSQTAPQPAAPQPAAPAVPAQQTPAPQTATPPPASQPKQ